jgi:hypothetical protein
LISICFLTDAYRHADRKLILECRVRAHPVPSVSWLRHGQVLQGDRYKQRYLDDDIYRLEITDPNVTDNGQYTCHATNDLCTEKISHMVHIEGNYNIVYRDTDTSDYHLMKNIIFQIENGNLRSETIEL